MNLLSWTLLVAAILLLIGLALMVWARQYGKRVHQRIRIWDAIKKEIEHDPALRGLSIKVPNYPRSRLETFVALPPKRDDEGDSGGASQPDVPG
jgi:hypothetical protein